MSSHYSNVDTRAMDELKELLSSDDVSVQFYTMLVKARRRAGHRRSDMPSRRRHQATEG